MKKESEKKSVCEGRKKEKDFDVVDQNPVSFSFSSVMKTCIFYSEQSKSMKFFLSSFSRRKKERGERKRKLFYSLKNRGLLLPFHASLPLTLTLSLESTTSRPSDQLIILLDTWCHFNPLI